MITENEAQSLVEKFIQLRKKAKRTKKQEDILKLREHEKLCIDKLKYLITTKTYKYRSFMNYDDLNQDGMEALMSAINTYDSDLGSFFWWSHRYIDTKIARSANCHTTIRFPLKFAKAIQPRREMFIDSSIQSLYSENIINSPDFIIETDQIKTILAKGMSKLTPEQQDLIDMVFGFNGRKSHSISCMCRKLRVSRAKITSMLNEIYTILRQCVVVEEK